MPDSDERAAFDETLLSVWKQALVDSAKRVRLGEDVYPVRSTAKSKLAQVDFQFNAYVAWNKIPRPPHAGRNWPAKALKLCSS